MALIITGLCLVAQLLCASANGASTCTDRPIIGILTQPTTDNLAQYGKSMLHAGNVTPHLGNMPPNNAKT